MIRRLPAEVLIDAIAQATDRHPHAGGHLVHRTSRPAPSAPRRARPVGGKNIGNYANKVFGASTRETNCDCNRSDEPNLLQSIYLQNDNDILATIDRPDGWLAEIKAAKAGRAKGRTQARRRQGSSPPPTSKACPSPSSNAAAQGGHGHRPEAKRIERLEGRIAAAREASNQRSKPKPVAPAGASSTAAEIGEVSIVREAYLRIARVGCPARPPRPRPARCSPDRRPRRTIEGSATSSGRCSTPRNSRPTTDRDFGSISVESRRLPIDPASGICNPTRV